MESGRSFPISRSSRMFLAFSNLTRDSALTGGADLEAFSIQCFGTPRAALALRTTWRVQDANSPMLPDFLEVMRDPFQFQGPFHGPPKVIQQLCRSQGMIDLS